MINQIIKYSDIFICPACGGTLKIIGNDIICLKCHNHYKIEDGIPLLFYQDKQNTLKKDVTNKIKLFYEQTPFPNYEKLENTEALIRKSEKGIFANMLNEQIPFNIKVLDVGCGTGQLSNFLGIYNRYVFGVDMSINSLKLGNKFRKNNNLKRVGFYQMNLFKPIFKKESFSIVICNGVLHHTSDPFAGFKSISKLVKKGGYIIIGLYNKYGRISTDIRRAIFKISKNHFKFLDSRLTDKKISDIKKATWFADQYNNPYEIKHTIKEILKWFDKTGFEFINSIPKTKFLKTTSANDVLFSINPRGNKTDHILAQIKMLFTIKNEGGFFIMIGKKT